MKNDFYQNLDNPVWHALQTVHQHYAQGTDEIRRYPSNMLHILGCSNPDTADLNALKPWIKQGEKFFVVGDLPPVATGWTIEVKLDCVQMVCENAENLITLTQEIFTLGEEDHSDMLELINLVQPGYFHKDTPLLGRYFGIRKDNKLVAMAGERLRMTGFTEISAVATHPSFTGNGFAQMLVSHVAKQNMDEGTVPFLHFLHTITRARKVYELLGFKERKIVPFWGLKMEDI